MKQKRVLIGVIALLVVLYGVWFACQMAEVPTLRSEEESYLLTTKSISFVVETGSRSVTGSPSGYGGWFEYSTEQGWKKVEVDPDIIFLLLAFEVPPFSSVSAVGVLPEAWNVAETGPGTYRFVLPCDVSLPFPLDSIEVETILTSNSFQLQ